MASSFSGPEHSVGRGVSRAARRTRFAVVVIAVAAAAAIGVAAARAGSCRVLVALGSVDIEPSPAGMSLRVSGNWEFDNIIQVATGLAFNVLLVRGDNFVRYRYPDQTFSGELAGLASSIDAGIDGKEILSVESAGATEPAARWVTLEAERMKLTSPVLSGDGPISIVAYIVLDGDYMSPIISNTITRPIELPVIDPNQGGDPGGTVTTR